MQARVLWGTRNVPEEPTFERCSFSLQSFSKCIQDPQKSEDLFTPLPQTTHERNPSKTSYKIPPLRFHKVPLLRKRSPFKSDFFSSFIIPDLQPSKPLHFSLLQALETAPVSLEISFPINSPPHFPCKLTILSFQLASTPMIHMDSWWAARNPK